MIEIASFASVWTKSIHNMNHSKFQHLYKQFYNINSPQKLLENCIVHKTHN